VHEHHHSEGDSSTSEEESGSSSSDDCEGGPVRKRQPGVPKQSQEESKSTIVNTLLGMTSQMRDFSLQVESRLDRTQKYGAAGKGMSGTNYETTTGNSTSKYEDRMLNKMQSQARDFIDSTAKRTMAIKAEGP
jgi:hypothetical protein